MRKRAKYTQHVAVRLTLETLEQLQETAGRLRRDVSELVRMYIEDGLDRDNHKERECPK